MPRIADALGANIRKLRESAKLSQQELADQLKVSRVTISNHERGEGGYTADAIAGYAKFFGVEETDMVRPPWAPSAALQDLVSYMREVEWTPTRLEVLRSVLTGFAMSSEKQALDAIDKLNKPGQKRK